jgi:hypothetical protein
MRLNIGRPFSHGGISLELKKRTIAVSRLDVRFAQERTRLGDLWGTRPIELTDTELRVRLSFHLTAGGSLPLSDEPNRL